MARSAIVAGLSYAIFIDMNSSQRMLHQRKGTVGASVLTTREDFSMRIKGFLRTSYASSSSPLIHPPVSQTLSFRRSDFPDERQIL